MYSKLAISILLTICLHSGVFSQAVVDTSYTADYLVKKVLLGSGVLAGNVKFTGEKHAISTYVDEKLELGIDKGILLTSGNAYYALGPNKSPRTGWASSAGGDAELEQIARGKTWDAAILEFDFVTSSENLSFEFVFASEEYLEYVGSKFNDVFGFFISGPGMKKTNIARLPDGKTPITVNTVNNELNSQYYLDNTYHNTTDPFIWDVRNRKVITNENYLQEEIPPNFDTQFDGFTSVLLAQCKVIPDQVYHIKIAIADVGDGILDSGVFLKGGSFSSYGDIVVDISEHFNEKAELIALNRKPVELIDDLTIPDIKISNRQLLGQIEFDFDKYYLSPHAASTIVRIFNEWKDKTNAKIELIGHTDSMGSHAYNDELSNKRANAVAEMLKELGVPNESLVLNYQGETNPIQTNATEVGRARNRRVEFFLTY